MSLPFLKAKKLASTIIMNTKTKEALPEDEHPAELMAISEQLISAIHAKDAKAVADVLSQLDKEEEQE